MIAKFVIAITGAMIVESVLASITVQLTSELPIVKGLSSICVADLIEAE